MFHPELQPELAERNITNFVPFDIPKKKVLKKKNKQELKCVSVKAGQEKRVSMPASVGPRTLRRAPALYLYNAPGYQESIAKLQDEITPRAMQTFFNPDN